MNEETLLRQQKYLNKSIDSKKVIKPMLGFKSFSTAGKTIAGIEVMHMIKKGQVDCYHSSVLSTVKFSGYLYHYKHL